MYNKHIIFGILLTAIILLASCGGGKPNYKVSLKTDTDSASYYLGYNWGMGIANSDIEGFNINAMARGVQEAIKHGKEVDQMKMQELQMFLNEYFQNLQNRASEKSLKAGQDFLEANMKKPGVVTSPSGLQYKILRDGSGVKPTREDEVDVVYHGTLIDGTEFESSKMRGDTVTFPVGNLVQGFTEALTMMSEGSIWEIYIPSELGYGEHVRPGGPIPPNAVLIFELDLVKVHKAE